MINNVVEQVELVFVISNDMKKVDMCFFQGLLCGVVKSVFELDDKICLYFGCLLEEFDFIEKVILCLVIFELIQYVEVLYKVVINEVIELVKVFGVEDSYKFINGVLDKVVCILCFYECGQW